MDSPLMARAKLTSEAMELGRELLSFMRREDNVQQMIAAAEAGRPSLGAVSDRLLKEFGDVVRDSQVKRRLGLFASAALDEHGYELHRSDIRMRDALFKYGSIFRKKSAADLLPSWVERVGGAMTEDEAAVMVRFLAHRFPRLARAKREIPPG